MAESQMHHPHFEKFIVGMIFSNNGGTGFLRKI